MRARARGIPARCVSKSDLPLRSLKRLPENLETVFVFLFEISR